ncbi:MAG: hypothetical protein OIN66_00925 [Candidatus Methanoperedens sp.]|nr:hypothetical protein [Candidatus Methanoperedens sp.]
MIFIHKKIKDNKGQISKVVPRLYAICLQIRKKKAHPIKVGVYEEAPALADALVWRKTAAEESISSNLSIRVNASPAATSSKARTERVSVTVLSRENDFMAIIDATSPGHIGAGDL